MLQFSADVVACNRVPANDTIEVLDTYNIAEPGRGNSLDPNQDVVVFNASFIDGRIICTYVDCTRKHVIISVIFMSQIFNGVDRRCKFFL